MPSEYSNLRSRAFWLPAKTRLVRTLALAAAALVWLAVPAQAQEDELLSRWTT